MDYKEKYEHGLECIQEILCGAGDSIKISILRKRLQPFFPELVESEDDKIRKAIISILKGEIRYISIEDTNKYVAWLEKQDKNSAEPKWCHHKVDLSNCSDEYRKAYYDGWNNCNMQHSQCKAEMNDVIKCLIHGMKYHYEDNEDTAWGTPKWNMPVRHIIEVLEKQLEQESVDKVEPKFKVGDWVTNGHCRCKISFIDSCYWYSETCVLGDITSIDKTFHLWTLQDAKNGDVLVNGSNIFIFHFINDTRLIGYCHVNIDDGRFYDDLGKNECFCTIDAIVTPATKEQRELLFQKMKEAGYEWNIENKELSKQTLKITSKFCVGQLITDDNGTWYKILNIKCLDDWYYELYDVCEDNTHLELCSIIDERFRENRFVGEIKKMMGD